MKCHVILGLVVSSSFFAVHLHAIGYADAVLSYDAGIGYATEFDTGLGFTLTDAALGLPNRDTSFGPVQPFNPPFERLELLSIGEGGHAVFQLNTPISNDAANPFGLDFLVYGSTGFLDIDYPNGHTDESASTFGQNTGVTIVSVSLDNVTFYTLDPTLAPLVDALFPTDGAGTFGLPVDPSVTPMDLADRSLEEIRAIYDGSAGGTGFDLDWTVDGSGQSVALDSARYVRIDVVSGRAEIDALTVVPEPSTWAFLAAGLTLFAIVFSPASRRITIERGMIVMRRYQPVYLLLVALWIASEFTSPAVTWREDFIGDPSLNGWETLGDDRLFAWREEEGDVHVTWDSSRPNSYFYKSLGTIVTREDNFTLAFDLIMEDISIGVDPSKPYTFQLALGLIRRADATNSNFFRGAGIHANYGPRNLVEFNYFPDSGFGDTFAPTVVSTNNRIVFSDNHPLPLTIDDRFHIQMEYVAAETTLRTTVTRNGEAYGLPPNQQIRDLPLAGFPDFRVDGVAICSYNDAHQAPEIFSGSLLAHGRVDNVEIIVPNPPVQSVNGGFQEGTWQVQFLGLSNWIYHLERRTESMDWAITDTRAGTTGMMTLTDESPPQHGTVFYRVKAER